MQSYHLIRKYNLWKMYLLWRYHMLNTMSAIAAIIPIHEMVHIQMKRGRETVRKTWRTMVRSCGTFPPIKSSSTNVIVWKTQLNSICVSVPQWKHIMSPLWTQQVNAIYRFVMMVYTYATTMLDIIHRPVLGQSPELIVIIVWLLYLKASQWIMSKKLITIFIKNLISPISVSE
jgi:hypothetical protein